MAKTRRRATGSPRRKAAENPDVDFQRFYCGKKGCRKRDFRKRIREHENGQEALEADDEEENSWILMQRESKQIAQRQWRSAFDISVAGLRGNNHETHSRCDTSPTGQWSNDQEIRRDNDQASTIRNKHHCQCLGYSRSQTNRSNQRPDGDGLRNRTMHTQTSGRRVKPEQGRGQFFLTVDSLLEVSKTLWNGRSTLATRRGRAKRPTCAVGLTVPHWEQEP